MQEVIIDGDPNQSSFGITKYTMDRLLKEKDCDKLIALYAFYCYTARWQETNSIRCTRSYAGKALGWSIPTVSKYNKRLKAMGLVESVVRRAQGHKSKPGGFEKHYVKVKYMVSVHS